MDSISMFCIVLCDVEVFYDLKSVFHRVELSTVSNVGFVCQFLSLQ